MKTVLSIRAARIFMIALVAAISTNVQGQQTAAELVFQNSSLYSGTAGNDGAVYKFPAVNNDLDALVTIAGRSSALVQLTQIDITGQGFPKAFQPQIRFNNGNVSGAQNWWMEFEIKFVNRNTIIPANISSFSVTGLDIDGNDDRLKEWQAYYSSSNYTLEGNTLLTTSNLVGTLSNILLPGKQFTGCLYDYGGIDTTATQIMTTLSYSNLNTMYIRMGGVTTGSTSNANRMYSTWFKSFTYNAPMTLPVKLISFSAMKNQSKIDLKWTTAFESQTSHFVIEKSTDGQTFRDAATVFAAGNSTSRMDYSFTDNLGTQVSGIVYYRLRIIDLDGSIEYSAIKAIRLDKKAENTITILTYPNPATSELKVTIPASWQNKHVSYEVFRLNGQLARRSESANSSQTESINVSQLQPGMYLVKVSCEGQAAQQKIIKQ